MHFQATLFPCFRLVGRFLYSFRGDSTGLSHSFTRLQIPPIAHHLTYKSYSRQHSGTSKMDELAAAQSRPVEGLPSRSKANGTTSEAVGFAPTTSDSTANVKASFTTINPVDGYRTHISEALAPITGVSAEDIYSKLQWTQTQDKGDLTLAVPALRIKGKKPNEQAAEWGGKVRNPPWKS